MLKLSALLAVVVSLTPHTQAASQVFLGNHDEATASATPFNEAFDAYVEQLLAEWHCPGVAIAVVHENKTWAKGYGFAEFPDKPVTQHTLFQGASTTKSFTASLAALLVDDNTTYNDIEWTTPIHDIVGNDFVLKDPYTTTHITLEDALSHRTGIPRHDAVWINQELGPKEEAYMLRYLNPSAEFRTKWQYCNLMYSTVSHVIQSVTGMWQGDVLRKRLWEPLGMKETYYSYEDAFTCETTNPDCKMAVSYLWNNNTSEYEEIPFTDYHAANGAGGVISNVLDYSHWIRALMYEAGPVSKESHKALRSPLSIQAVEMEPFTGPLWYGMGLDGGAYCGEKVWGHNGGIGAYFSKFQFLPERKFGYVVFQNGPGFITEIAGWRLLDEFLETPKNEYAKVNEMFHGVIKEQEKNMKDLPSELYPDVPSTPIQPSLKLEDYEGTYHHPGYGNFTMSMTPPASVETCKHSPSERSESAALSLYTKTKYENGLFTFHHVSGEHWLVEMRMHLHNTKYPQGMTKAKFEIGPSGTVDKLAVIIEPRVQGEQGWCWFERI